MGASESHPSANPSEGNSRNSFQVCKGKVAVVRNKALLSRVL